MGEDFIKKTENSYRRSTQRAMRGRLFELPLFSQTEDATTAYPCRLTEPVTNMGPEATLLLHRRQDGSIDILDEHRVIGTVEGAPCQDLNAYLDEQPAVANMIKVRPLHTDGTYLEFSLTIAAEHQL
ncbi:MAG TPA: hypothetical protein VHW45_20150 [Candidatus Sulfotelmatobacter sp.]|jgi:hypothetical protein|nr:hypothetical protein [Candidatus Sulfotelmatobacter sp.]